MVPLPEGSTSSDRWACIPRKQQAPTTTNEGEVMGRVEGKVAFITGAARGQGRSHALRLAEEGADIIAVDFVQDIDTVPYGLASRDEFELTVKQVEATGRRIVAVEADVRDYDALKAAVDRGVDELGRLDIVSANAGVLSLGKAHELTEQTWRDMIDVNLTGVWHTTKAVTEPMIDLGNGGSIIITSSTAGVKGLANAAHYTAAKHGIVGLMKSLVNELSQYRIRVNTVHPTRTSRSPPSTTSRSRLASSATFPMCRGWSRPTCPTHSSSWRPTRPATSPAPSSGSMPDQ
jgi:(+)-trans-carveol dehydrogenase